MRRSGVLLSLSSLPSPHGIGTMGEAAREFADFLSEAGQKLWQILPICPTGYGDSPYQSFSTFAGNPYFLDFDLLAEEGLLKKEEYEGIDWESEPGDINYGALYEKKYPVLRLAAARLEEKASKDYECFCLENESWLSDYALFMALKDEHGGAPWWLWETALRERQEEALLEAKKRLSPEVSFWEMVQYLFFRQWTGLKAYVNEKGISIIGDLPIYVSQDSADVWAHPELFQLDENRMPREIAGCPPDGFSADGQLWGNPLFDWEEMAKDDYAWWVNRIGYLCKVYDVLRIDHFRGFDSYYAIPYGARSAEGGCWKKGPGMDLFRAVEHSIGRQPIIAEDLGFLTDSVKALLKESGFPGMRVLELAFDSRDNNGSGYLPHNFIKECVAYAGTHDNDTILGWFATADAKDTAWAKEYFHFAGQEDLNWGMMSALWASVADMAIVQAQDLLALGSEARMNEPATVGDNWRWRAKPGSFTPELAQKIRRYMRLYER